MKITKTQLKKIIQEELLRERVSSGVEEIDEKIQEVEDFIRERIGSLDMIDFAALLGALKVRIKNNLGQEKPADTSTWRGQPN